MSKQPKAPPLGRKIATDLILNHKAEPVAEATLYGSTSRFQGRRIILRVPGGDIIHDTGEQHDSGNAINNVEWFLMGFLGPNDELRAKFEAGHVPREDDMTHRAYLNWKKEKEQTPVEVVVGPPDPVEAARLADDGGPAEVPEEPDGWPPGENL